MRRHSPLIAERAVSTKFFRTSQSGRYPGLAVRYKDFLGLRDVNESLGKPSRPKYLAVIAGTVRVAAFP
jgi:hypothetical protein